MIATNANVAIDAESLAIAKRVGAIASPSGLTRIDIHIDTHINIHIGMHIYISAYKHG